METQLFNSGRKFLPGIISLFMLFSLFTLFTCNQAAIFEPIPPIFSVSGVISTDDPEGPAEGAVVRLFQGDIIIGNEFITGADGKYSLPVTDAGDNYSVEASLPGYESSRSGAFSVTEESISGINLNLTKIVILFTVSGTITEDGAAHHLEGAKVQLLRNNSVIAETLSAEDGSYTFAGLAIGTGFTIEVFLEGYELSVTGPFDVSENASLIKNLALVKLTEPVYRVSGTIFLDNPAGPAEGAALQLKLGEENAGITVTTDSDGLYVIENVKAGEGYTIKVSLEGFKDGVIDSFSVVNNDVSDKDLTLTRIVYSVSGKITLDNTAVAASGATVTLKKQDGSNFATANTNEKGEYSFDNVLPGSGYTIEALFTGYTPKTSDPFNVNADVQDKNITLVKPTYSVKGKITLDNPSGPAKDIAVQLKKDGSNVDSAATNASGDYTFNNLVSGSYTITVSLTGYETGTASFSVTNADVTGKDIMLKKNAAPNLIPNPSLETGSSSPTGWSKENWYDGSPKPTLTYTYLNNDAHDGSRSVKVEVSGAVIPISNDTFAYSGRMNGDAKWTCGAIQLAAGKDYLFSDWYKSNVDSRVLIGYETNILESNGKTYKTKYYELPVVPASEVWTKYETTFTVPIDSRNSKIEIFHMMNKNGWLITDEYYLGLYNYTGFSEGMVTITFDDDWEGNPDKALPIMQQHGFKSTQYYRTDSIKASTSSAKTQIRKFIAAGHEIGAHSETHPWLTAYDSARVIKEVKGSKEYLEEFLKDDLKNYPDLYPDGKLRHFSTPFGDYNTFVKNTIMDNFETHRTVDIGFNSKDNFDKTRLKCMGVEYVDNENIEYRTTQAEFEAWVTKAKNEKLWLILLYHRVASDPGSSDVHIDMFRHNMQFIKDSGIQVMMMSDALAVLEHQTGN